MSMITYVVEEKGVRERGGKTRNWKLESRNQRGKR